MQTERLRANVLCDHGGPFPLGTQSISQCSQIFLSYFFGVQILILYSWQEIYLRSISFPRTCMYVGDPTGRFEDLQPTVLWFPTKYHSYRRISHTRILDTRPLLVLVRGDPTPDHTTSLLEKTSGNPPLSKQQENGHHFNHGFGSPLISYSYIGRTGGHASSGEPIDTLSSPFVKLASSLFFIFFFLYSI